MKKNRVRPKGTNFSPWCPTLGSTTSLRRYSAMASMAPAKPFVCPAVACCRRLAFPAVTSTSTAVVAASSMNTTCLVGERSSVSPPMCTGAHCGSSISRARWLLGHGISRWRPSVMCGVMMSTGPSAGAAASWDAAACSWAASGDRGASGARARSRAQDSVRSINGVRIRVAGTAARAAWTGTGTAPATTAPGRPGARGPKPPPAPTPPPPRTAAAPPPPTRR